MKFQEKQYTDPVVPQEDAPADPPPGKPDPKPTAPTEEG